MRRILPLIAFAAAIVAAPRAQAQEMAFSLTRTQNLAGGGWDVGETFSGTALRIEFPGRLVVPFVSVARPRIEQAMCAGDCGDGGTPTLFLVGTSFRPFADGAGRVVPYAGVATELTAWDNGDRRIQPHLHAGVDGFLTRLVAVRVEGQTNWSVPGNVSVGLRVRVP